MYTQTIKLLLFYFNSLLKRVSNMFEFNNNFAPYMNWKITPVFTNISSSIGLYLIVLAGKVQIFGRISLLDF